MGPPSPRLNMVLLKPMINKEYVTLNVSKVARWMSTYMSPLAGASWLGSSAKIAVFGDHFHAEKCCQSVSSATLLTEPADTSH